MFYKNKYNNIEKNKLIIYKDDNMNIHNKYLYMNNEIINKKIIDETVVEFDYKNFIINNLIIKNHLKKFLNNDNYNYKYEYNIATFNINYLFKSLLKLLFLYNNYSYDNYSYDNTNNLLINVNNLINDKDTMLSISAKYIKQKMCELYNNK